MSSEPSHLSSTWILHVHVRCLGSLFAAAARRYTYPCSRNHDKQTPRPSAAHSASWPRSNSRNQPNHHLQQDDAVAGTPWRRCDRQPDETRRLETAQYHTNDTRRDETRQTRLSYLTCSHYLRSVLPVSYLTYLPTTSSPRGCDRLGRPILPPLNPLHSLAREPWRSQNGRGQQNRWTRCR